jgi:hypothetical protein
VDIASSYRVKSVSRLAQAFDNVKLKLEKKIQKKLSKN